MTKLCAIGTTVIACASVAITHVRAADAITGATAAMIQKWTRAVEGHAAGRPDDAVAMVCSMSYRDRVDMNAGMDLFFAALPGGELHSKEDSAAQAVIAAGHAAGQALPATFLKRAAMLHTDAALFRASFPPPVETSAYMSSRSTNSLGFPVSPSPLLMNKPLVTGEDGEIIGSRVADWNWPFARDLLDRLISPRERERDPFLGAWYHAVAAYMLKQGLYGDAEDHLTHAAGMLPNDARVLFDRASFAEIMGLPKVQAHRTSGQSLPSNVHIPPATNANAEAERLFRRALELDPRLVEAHVRIGRLLDTRGAHAEALVELRGALEANPPSIVAFYAHLFAARASLNAGSVRDASNHYRDALSLYPNAQSALLGVSQTAWLVADVAGALAPVEQLGPKSVSLNADPWRQYDLAAGRDADELLRKLWAATPSGPQTGRVR